MLKSIDEGTKVLIVGIIFAVMLIFILLVPVK